MRRLLFLPVFLVVTIVSFAQKKPLDHSVYDSWQSIGERMISNDGKWVVYSVNVQEGDNELVIQSTDAKYKKTIPRGYSAVITEDSRYAVFKIKPLYKDTRDARIKKKRPDDMPKDSFAIVQLGQDSVWKTARVKTYKTPEKEAGWVAFHMEKTIEKKDSAAARPRRESPDKKITDSLNRVIDSLHAVITNMPQPKKKKNKDGEDSLFEEQYTDFADGDEPAAPADAGTDLLVRSLNGGKEKTFANVLEYYFSKKGGKLLIEQARNAKDSLSKAKVILYDLNNQSEKVLSNGGNEFKGFSFSEDGSQLAYLAERDAKPKELQKFYKIWYYKDGMDSATLLADKNSVGMQLGMTVSENGNLVFSKSGKRLFFGTAPIQPPKDTTLVDIDLVKVDVWNYKDDYLQTMQLSRLQRDLQTNYLAVYLLDKNVLNQLGSEKMPTIYQTNEGDGDRFVGVTDFGKRIESQWTGNTKKDLYSIDVNSGEAKLVKKDVEGGVSPSLVSPTGKYIAWYDSKAKNYFAWDGTTIRNITAGIKFPLWDEDHDSPSDPGAYGAMGWHEGDSILYVYDRYGVWKVDPAGKKAPVVLSGVNNRAQKTAYRYVRTNSEERFITSGQDLLFRVTNETNKNAGLFRTSLNGSNPSALTMSAVSYGPVSRAEDARVYLFAKESYAASPDLNINNLDAQPVADIKLSAINPQQKEYNWLTAELYKWTAFNGKPAQGILYKPEDFDPKKKYPVVFYFYETHTDNLNSYMPPAPTGSRLDITFFVSRGYIVVSPDIHYTNGHPAKSCYDYVVSAAKSLAKLPWIDAKNMGIQGQSWGGIQVAQLVTMTDMFKAAWAGAPVANMTSAYGGIRWESGSNRQFQYEKTQSRIGATLWEKPELYIENSPLFHLPKVKTPLVIMANDADGAVPWYQGIELFTGMRRLGKKVWMLNYNGEAHNLVQRINKKDISIREQQYFDWLLKGAKAPKWIEEGVPAVKKGKDWGLELVD